LEKIIESKKVLEQYRKLHTRRMGYKWIALIISILSVWLIVYFAVIPAINYLFLSTKSADELRKALVGGDKLIPEGSSIQDIVPQDMLLTSWDLNHRTPRFFTKKSQLTMNSTEANHNMSLDKMVVASGATPYYFQPYTVEGSFYISGDNVAMSPAMFAYFYANEQLKIKSDRIRVVSVGSTNQLPDKIEKDASILTWASRLTSLVGPVKKHTQDYMVTYIA
jgi:patatin-like phospholipase/acyl hydrolase